MKLKTTLLAALAGAAGLLAAPAFADDDRHRGWDKHQWKHYKKHRGHHGHDYGYHYSPRPVVVVPAPRYYYAPPPQVVYAPPPAVVYPAPAYYPAPVHRAPEPGVSIRFSLPL